jgi:hypothetical protein
VRERVLEELVADDRLALLLIAAEPLDIDGQKLPVCCRQLNSVSQRQASAEEDGLPFGESRFVAEA